MVALRGLREEGGTMGRRGMRRDAHRWERIADVMRDTTDASRITEMPGRSWKQVSQAVISAIKDFQMHRLKGLADRPTPIQPPGLE